ncbi:cell wall-binding repeat-containing protein [Kineococcus sp. SYSU DK004]|uniref:cell wall-binding repeat-containing protein n=1 Tax=Kineococcus sp. SYSU DK004 TaxID=3383125 RepID=UPI003D7CDF76
MTTRSSKALRRAAAALALAGLVAGAASVSAQASPLRFNSNYGPDRYVTSVVAEGNPLATAFIVTGENYPDGLSAGAVAGMVGGNVYLTPQRQLTQEVRERVVYAQRIVVVGSEASVGADVMTWLRQNTRAELLRVGGDDRVATAAALSARFYATPAPDRPGVRRVVIATGYEFPDALTGSAAAAHVESPLLLVPRDALPGAVVAELQRLRPQAITVVGGSSRVSDAVLQQLRQYTAGPVERVAGADRYDTAVRVSRDFFSDARSVVLASGETYADALAAGAVAGRAGGPLLLAAHGCVTEGANLEIERLQRLHGEASALVSFGGPSRLSEDTLKRTNCQPAGTPDKTYLDELTLSTGSARYLSDHATISGRFYPRSAAFDVDPRNSDYRAWSLDGRFARFTAVAGFADLDLGGFTSTVDVYGDEKLLASRVVAPGEPASFNVDVRGVDNLKIVTTSPQAGSPAVGNANRLYFGDAAVS